MFKVISAITVLVFMFITASQSFAFEVPKAKELPTIDGVGDDNAWQKGVWHNIDQIIIGEQPEESDFSGRFKVVWGQNKLYVLAEIIDETLIDKVANPLEQYWNDDTFEILLDEDHSGGDHLKNYNAFAYHIALDNQAVDINQSGKPRLLNDHIHSVWQRLPNDTGKLIWEVSVDVYPDTFKDNYDSNQSPATPVKLKADKKMGFLIAYCDNDGAEQRDNFITSYDIPAVDGDKNRAYFDAGVFQTILLTGE